MRTLYREHLDNFSRDLIVMCEAVRSIMSQASNALLTCSLDCAEDSLAMAPKLKEIRKRSDARAFELLAEQSSASRDLRQVISSIYIVDDMDRMGALAMHIARAARRLHPDPVVPESLEESFSQLAELSDVMASKTVDILRDPNVDIALALRDDDDAVDELNHSIFRRLTSPDWKHSTRSAVDSSQLSRFYERYCDHCVNVAGRIVYLTTGLSPEEYRSL